MDDGKVVGWFQGRWSSGPARSGAAASSGTPAPDMQQKMNLKIKFRGVVPPLRAVRPRELADQVFEVRPEEDSAYMLQVAAVRDRMADDVLTDEDESGCRILTCGSRCRPRSRIPADHPRGLLCADSDRRSGSSRPLLSIDAHGSTR